MLLLWYTEAPPPTARLTFRMGCTEGARAAESGVPHALEGRVGVSFKNSAPRICTARAAAFRGRITGAPHA